MTLLTEPMAAALYYARQSNMSEGEKLLVYDLGGGTFDTALLQKKGDTFKYLALPSGIERCGGIDFDRAIYDDLILQHPELQELLRVERDDSMAMLARTLMGELCISLKHQLSEAEEVEEPIVLPGLSELIDHHLTRKTFNQMIAPTIRETITCCQNMIQSANTTWEQVDRVVLVGGSCRIPYVQYLLQQEFKRPLHVAPDLELVVCQGAALYALQNEIYVVSGTPGDAEYTTIGAALYQAKPKSRIVVRPGTYKENVVLDREVEILGVGAKESVIIESATGVGLKMATATATVHNITLRHTATDAPTWKDHGAVVVPQGHLTLEDCHIVTEVHGIAVRGTGSNTTLRRCHILAKKNASVAIVYGGHATIEDCDISGNSGPGIHVRDKGSSATIQRCQIHDRKSLGISISAEAQTTIEDCQIFENASTGIQVCDEKSSATIGRCRIYQGDDKGIALWQKAQASIEGCEIYDNVGAGVLAGDAGSSATIRQCKVYDGKFIGIAVLKQGQVSIEECDIYHNAGSGIKAKDEGSRVTVLQSQVHHGVYAGIDIQGKSYAEINACAIFNNAGPGVRIHNLGSKATINESQIHDGNAVGLLIEDEGKGVINNTKLAGNRVDIYVEPGSVLEGADESISQPTPHQSNTSMPVFTSLLLERVYLEYEGRNIDLNKSEFTISGGRFRPSEDLYVKAYRVSDPDFIISIKKQDYRYILNAAHVYSNLTLNGRLLSSGENHLLQDEDRLAIGEKCFTFYMK